MDKDTGSSRTSQQEVGQLSETHGYGYLKMGSLGSLGGVHHIQRPALHLGCNATPSPAGL